MISASPCYQFDTATRAHRRQLLKVGGLSLLGLGLPQFLAERRVVAADAERAFGRAKSCILLFMWGGPAHQDTWDMKPDAPAEIRGEFKPISTNVPGIQICEHFPQMARRVQQLALVRSMTHTDVNHTSGTHFLLTGEPPPANGERNSQWPHIGAVLSRLGRGAGPLPPFVSMRPRLDNDVPRFVEESQGQWGGWLGSRYDPLIIDHNPNLPDYHVADLALRPDLGRMRMQERRQLLQSFQDGVPFDRAFLNKESQHQRAFDLLASAGEQRNAFDLTREPDAVRERYGKNPHGQSVLQARRLIERGVPLVTVFWPSDGIKNVSVYWDTHSRNFIDLKERLMPVADQAFAALLDDLGERGMLDETLVIWTGEFGRTPRVGQRNSDAGAGADGRDHWPGCFTTVLAGAGVPGGMVYGRSDRHAAYPAAEPVAPHDLTATVYHLLGVPASQTLPDQTGRPIYVRTGKVIPQLLA